MESGRWKQWISALTMVFDTYRWLVWVLVFLLTFVDRDWFPERSKTEDIRYFFDLTTYRGYIICVDHEFTIFIRRSLFIAEIKSKQKSQFKVTLLGLNWKLLTETPRFNYTFTWQGVFFFSYKLNDST
jgi:hypothetical protein